MVSNKGEIRMLCWVVKRVYEMQGGRKLRIYDENGDEIGAKVEEEGDKEEWEAIHEVFTVDQRGEDDDNGDIEKNVSKFVWVEIDNEM